MKKYRITMDADMKTPEEKLGYLQKFGADLDDQTYREDPHFLFSNCQETKWIDFIRETKERLILFKQKATEALEKDEEARTVTYNHGTKKRCRKAQERQKEQS